MINALNKQYSLTVILVLWLLVTIPMGIARFLIMPLFAPRLGIYAGVVFWCLMVAGMIWQCALSLIVLKIELGTLSFAAIKKRLWLNHPIRENGKPFMLVYLFTIPFILYAFFFESSGLFEFVDQGFVSLFPFFAPPDYVQIQSLARPEFHGAWYIVVIAVISSVFNYLLGEELFFRGILLPKMRGVFGKYDWIANGVLFSLYHLHKISEVPLMLVGSFFLPFLNKRYLSFWPAVIIHGVEVIPLFIGVIWAVYFL